ncbi:MAG TPA: AI-2E family transporter [Gemmatimonadaceae bacterium]|nr:AI-2E family transporter [Gemmatimonadaceae bacterium]HTK51622.1 AI-2E family transporter [Gemmatimonadaceae bacterium]
MSNDTPPRGSRFKFAPILTATVLTILLLWMFKTVANVFVLLLLGVLVSLYLRALADWIENKTGAPERIAFLAAVLGTVGAVVLLCWVLVPPVIDQTRQLFLALPRFIAGWEAGIDQLADRMPGLRDLVGPSGDHRTLKAAYDQLSGLLGSIPNRVFEAVHLAINVFAVGVMGIYLALHPALYREWLIALFPPIHRDLVRDVLVDLADSLRAYIVGQLLTMTFLGAITALGLYVLDVPFWLPFGIFTGLVAIIPFFGTLLSTTLPALFVLTGPGYHGFSPFGHALLVVGLGVVVHLIEGNVVSPLVMSKKVDLPPVLTIMSVLVIGQLLGGIGLLVALPTLVTVMVIVRRILISRIYEGQGFRRTTRERPLVLRLPVPGGGVIAPPGPPLDVISDAERAGLRRSA